MESEEMNLHDTKNNNIYIFPKTTVSLHDVTSLSVRKVSRDGTHWFELSVECGTEATDGQKLTEVHNMAFFIKDGVEVSIESEDSHGNN